MHRWLSVCDDTGDGEDGTTRHIIEFQGEVRTPGSQKESCTSLGVLSDHVCSGAVASCQLAVSSD